MPRTYHRNRRDTRGGKKLAVTFNGLVALWRNHKAAIQQACRDTGDRELVRKRIQLDLDWMEYYRKLILPFCIRGGAYYRHFAKPVTKREIFASDSFLYGESKGNG